MQASRWIAVWIAVGALGIAGAGAGCGGDDGVKNDATTSATATTTGEGSASSTGTGGAQGTGAGGSTSAGTGGAGGGGGTGGAGGGGGTGGAGGGGGTGGAGGGGGTGGAGGGGGTGGAGGTMDPLFDFSLRGARYTGYEDGDRVYVDLYAAGATEATLHASDAIGPDGTFSVFVTGKVPGGKAYTIYWYVDSYRNGECDATEDVWKMDIPTVTANIERSVQGNTNFAECP
ncbi:hypothetical protein WMF28_17440 [Sorangium sp. So ce590]|uniref:hypothetical protein n=1 Tax=Sorangium sp. So ce590 TaxID=3133317 RepID=UPI003F62855E